jgi:hypothetical protein
MFVNSSCSDRPNKNLQTTAGKALALGRPARDDPPMTAKPGNAPGHSSERCCRRSVRARHIPARAIADRRTRVVGSVSEPEPRFG